MAAPTPDEPYLCAAFLNGTCHSDMDCSSLHHSLPYLWQVRLDQAGWTQLQEERLVMQLEMAFCKPGSVACNIEIPITYHDGVVVMTTLKVDFEQMVGHLQHPADRWAEQSFMELRRLATRSYASCPLELQHVTSNPTTHTHPLPATCPWRWYYDDGPTWKLFEEDEGSPMQCVLEAKYLAGQKIYRFELDLPYSMSSWSCSVRQSAVFLLNFPRMSLLNLITQVQCRIRRRPLFVCPDHCLLRKFPPPPPTKPNPWGISEMPQSWFPIEQKADYELVPLDPESVDYHLVASEFIRYGLPNWNIIDIYRLQNPYLWHKFTSKKQYMEQKTKNANELLLFHGTAAETSVQAIFRQNFDWRLSGKNAVAFGDGSYFARDPALSDKYTGGGHIAKTRWMFLARVLVGNYALGKIGYKRPPPLDAGKPHGDLYDSCVNKLTGPSIYVVFDNDQCYPEYVISYTR